MPKQTEAIKETDIVKEVDATIDKDAFKGPFTCHNKKTKKLQKKIAYQGLEFTYEVWHCPQCKKEYLDAAQAEKLESFWILQRLLDNKTITMERTMNYDGKTFFFRFPKELTKNWHKGSHVDIKLLTPEKFLIEVKA